MIQFAIEYRFMIAIVWFGVCLFVANAIENRRWRRDAMARNVAALMARR